MMELKDIVLNRGDIIYFKDCNYLCTGGEGELFDFLIEVKKNECDITKIERPVKYETIYEAPKEILDKEEKEKTILKKALKKMYNDLSNACQALLPYEWYIEQAKKE